MDTQTVTDIQKITADLLSHLEVAAEPVVEVDESEVIKINITPEQPEEGLGFLIGYHGETLKSLQAILALMINREREEWFRIAVDVDGYRLRHEESLRSLARRTAEKTLFLKEPVELSPMSASDRRIIHLQIAQLKGVMSESTGEGWERRVIVKPEA
ncbi:MAG: KH domain-containing protein [Candidatus Cloacimonetes bacterium]|nr:KH domain-containing protein [Candidatus Cloacimonadota bacterium]